MVDFGSEQGLSNFETAGIAGYVEDFKRAKTSRWAKRCRLWMDTNYMYIGIPVQRLVRCSTHFLPYFFEILLINLLVNIYEVRIIFIRKH